MRKRLCAIWLTVAMLSASLVGCGDAQESNSNVGHIGGTDSGTDTGSVDTGSSDTGSVISNESDSLETDDVDMSASASETEEGSNEAKVYSTSVVLKAETEDNIKSMIESTMNSIDYDAGMFVWSGDRSVVRTKGELRDALLSNRAGDSIVAGYDADQFNGLMSMCSIASDLIGQPAVNHYKVKTGDSWSYGCSSVEVVDSNIVSGFHYFEGTDAVIGMYVKYKIECKHQVYGSDSSWAKKVDDSRTGYLAVSLVNNPENPSKWQISGIYPVNEIKDTATYVGGVDNTGNPTFKNYGSGTRLEIDAPEELLETCFNFENKLLSETAQQALQEIDESSNEDFQAAIDAYSQQFAESAGALFELSCSSIPFYWESYYRDGLFVDFYIYHFEGGQIVQVYGDVFSRDNAPGGLSANYNDNIVGMSSFLYYGEMLCGLISKYYEYKDGVFQNLYTLYLDFGAEDDSWITSYKISYQGGEWQDIDEETYSSIQDQSDGITWCPSFSEALVAYTHN